MRRIKEFKPFRGFIKVVIGETMYSQKTLYIGCGLLRSEFDTQQYISVSIGLIWVFATLKIRIWGRRDAET